MSIEGNYVNHAAGLDEIKLSNDRLVQVYTVLCCLSEHNISQVFLEQLKAKEITFRQEIMRRLDKATK